MIVEHTYNSNTVDHIHCYYKLLHYHVPYMKDPPLKYRLHLQTRFQWFRAMLKAHICRYHISPYRSCKVFPHCPWNCLLKLKNQRIWQTYWEEWKISITISQLQWHLVNRKVSASWILATYILLEELLWVKAFNQLFAGKSLNKWKFARVFHVKTPNFHWIRWFKNVYYKTIGISSAFWMFHKCVFS